jgi:hypothetical protein
VKRVLLLVLAAASGGCPERRQPIRVHGDGGPAVVVVDPIKRNPQMPPVALVDETEPNDDLPHAQPMEAGKGVRGTIGAPQPGKGPKGKPKPDVDVYSWLEPGSAPDGGFNEARVELTGVGGLDLSLEVLSGDGARLWLANDNGAGEPEVAPNVAFEPGHTYYLRVHAQGEQSDPAHPYELVIRSAQAPAGAEREPNDDTARATVLAALTDSNGFFGRRRDEDWLKLPPPPTLGGAPPILRVELGPVEGVAPELKVLAGSAVLAAARAGRGEELRLRNVGLPSVENLFVMLKAAEGKNYLDRWTLKLGVEPALDGAEREPNDTIDHAHAIALDGAQPVAGFLWPGDVDLYRVTGAADALFTAELDGLERVDLKLDRLSPDGKQLARADDNGVGQGERLPPWPVGVSGAALVRVTARARDTAFDAPYRLTIAAVPPDAELEREPNDARENATPWREGARTMHGYLAPRGDVDVYKFVAPAGKAQATAVIDAHGSSLKVAITGEAGLPSAPTDQPGRSTCALTAGKTYFITVKGATEKTSNAREPYTITLTFD